MGDSLVNSLIEIVRADDNGDLQIIEENLDQILKLLEQQDCKTATLVSFFGSPEIGCTCLELLDKYLNDACPATQLINKNSQTALVTVNDTTALRTIEEALAEIKAQLLEFTRNNEPASEERANNALQNCISTLKESNKQSTTIGTHCMKEDQKLLGNKPKPTGPKPNTLGRKPASQQVNPEQKQTTSTQETNSPKVPRKRAIPNSEKSNPGIEGATLQNEHQPSSNEIRAVVPRKHEVAPGIQGLISKLFGRGYMLQNIFLSKPKTSNNVQGLSFNGIKAPDSLDPNSNEEKLETNRIEEYNPSIENESVQQGSLDKTANHDSHENISTTDHTELLSDSVDETSSNDEFTSSRKPSFSEEEFYESDPKNVTSVYMWPRWIPVAGGQQLVGIMMLHPKSQYDMEGANSLQNILLGITSSKLVDFDMDRKSNFTAMTQLFQLTGYSNLDLCRNVIHITKKTNQETQRPVRGKDGHVFLEFDESWVSHNEHDRPSELYEEEISRFTQIFIDHLKVSTRDTKNIFSSSKSIKQHILQNIQDINNCRLESSAENTKLAEENSWRQQWESLKPKLENFIFRKLDCHNINQIENLDDQSKLSSSVSSNNNTSTDKVVQSITADITNIFANLMFQMVSIFIQNDYTTPPNFENMMMINIRKMLKEIEHEEISFLAEKGCQILLVQFKAFSSQLMEYYQQCLLHIILRSSMFDPDLYFQIHCEIMHELLALEVLSPFEEQIKILIQKSHFPNKIQETFDKNMQRLERAQKKIKQIISKCKSEYEERMETDLSKNSHGMTHQAFARIQHAAANISFQKLINSVQQEVDQSDTDACVKVLQSYIEQSAPALKEVYGVEGQDAIPPQNTQPEPKPNRGPQPSVRRQPTVPRARPRIRQDKKSLPPLFFQISMNKITIGILKRGGPSERSLQQVTFTHNAEVGLSKNDEWFCGNQVQSGNEDYFKHIWKLQNCFEKIQWQDEIVMKNERTVLTTELLLAIFFSAFKKEIEAEEGGEINSAFVSVPFWTTCVQRKEIMDALKIAGFVDSFIINENSAAAYSYYSSTSFRSDIVILSENVNKIDVSLHIFDEETKRVTLLGHSGNYQIVPKIGHRNAASFDGYNNTDKSIDGMLIENSDLSRLWSLAHANAKEHLPTYKFIPKNVIVSSTLKLIDKQNLKSISLDENIISRNPTCILEGLVSIFNYLAVNSNSSVKNLIKDGSPLNVKVTLPKGIVTTAQKCTDTFYNDSGQFMQPAARCNPGEYQYFEENSIESSVFGTLKIPTLLEGKSFRCIFQTTNDGIIALDHVEFMSGSKGSEKFPVGSKCSYFDWKTSNLSNSEMRFLESTFRTFIIPSGNTAKVNLLQDAIELGRKIRDEVMTGEYQFKSSIVRNKILEKVESVLKVLSQSEVDEEEVMEQITLLQKTFEFIHNQ